MNQTLTNRSMLATLVALFSVSACGAASVLASQKAPPDDVVVVEVEGEGLSKDEAVKAALRSALEQGGRNEIFSETHVQNYELMRDTIISRAQGIVTDFTVISERRGVGGTYKVRIKARVSKRALAETWGELQNVLNQIGRPKILVSIAERIDCRLEEQSILETKIEERLLRSGFDVVAAGAAAALRDTEVRIATAGQTTSKLQALAKDSDAHIFITGTVNADHAGIEDLYGVPAAFYNCDVQIRAYYTDTAKLLASKGIPVTRGGARGRSDFSPQAGKMAIVNVSGPLVDGLYEQILRQWATAISAGGELVLEVEGLNYKSGSRIKSMLAKLEGVEHVGFKLTRGVGTYHINAKMGAEILAERLSAGEFGNLFDIVDLKLNRIQGKAVGG